MKSFIKEMVAKLQEWINPGRDTAVQCIVLKVQECMRLAHPDYDSDVDDPYCGVDYLDGLKVDYEVFWDWGVIDVGCFSNNNGEIIGNCTKCFCVLPMGRRCNARVCNKQDPGRGLRFAFKRSEELGSITYNPYLISCAFHPGVQYEYMGIQDEMTSLVSGSNNYMSINTIALKHQVMIHLRKLAAEVNDDKEKKLYYSYHDLAEKLFDWTTETKVEDPWASALAQLIRHDTMQEALKLGFRESDLQMAEELSEVFTTADHAQQECVEGKPKTDLSHEETSPAKKRVRQE